MKLKLHYRLPLFENYITRPAVTKCSILDVAAVLDPPLLSRIYNEVFFLATSFQLLTIFSSLVWSYMRLRTSQQTFPLVISKMVLITATSNRNSYIDLFLKLCMSLKPLACNMPATKAVCSYETMAVKGFKIMLWL